jgi:hypothetical protein
VQFAKRTTVGVDAPGLGKMRRAPGWFGSILIASYFCRSVYHEILFSGG